MYLSDIATRPDCRGQGYFRRLLGHVSAQYPGRMLRLLTREENACRIYQRAGFVIEKENIVTIHKETNHAAGIF